MGACSQPETKILPRKRFSLDLFILRIDQINYVKYTHFYRVTKVDFSSHCWKK